ARRSRRAAVTIVLGLAVGTSILSASFATGDSTTQGIRESAMAAFGRMDETVGVEGDLFFPAWVGDRLAEHPAVRRELRALSPLVLASAAVSNADASQWEPRALLVGYDPERSGALSPFHDASGALRGDRLRAGEVVLNRELAETIGARAGDRIELRYAAFPDPLLPEVFWKNGTLSASALGPQGYVHAPQDDHELSFPVHAGARFVTAVLLWRDGVADLDVELVSPSGRSSLNANGTTGAPDVPAILNATGEAGTWTARVHAKAAANVPFQLSVLAFYEIYDLDRIRSAESAYRNESRRVGGPDLDDILRPQLRSKNVTVAFVASQEGRGAFLNAPNIFLRLDELQGMLEKEGRINLLAASNAADVEEGLARTDRGVAALRHAVDDLRRTHADEPVVASLKVEGIKKFWVDQALESGSLFSNFLTMMGSFSILAGLVLVANVFSMVVEERRAELGIARAIGLRRRDLVKAFVAEGMAYGAVATVLGTLLGLALAALLLAGVNAAVADRLQLVIPFHVEARSAAAALAAGVLLAAGAVLVSAWRASRLHVVSAIRRLEAPDTTGARATVLAGGALAVLGAGVSYAGFAYASFSAVLLGPSVIVLGLALLSLRLARRSTAAKLAGVGLLVYSFATIVAIRTPDTTEAMIMGPVRALVMVVAAVLFIIHVDRLPALLARLLGRVRGLRPAILPAIAYPLHRKLRTGLTAVVFALVITVVVLFSIFFAIFTPDVRNHAGSYDVRAESTLPVDDLPAALGFPSGLPGARAVDHLVVAEVWGGELLRIDGKSAKPRGPPIDRVFGYDESFGRNADLPLLEIHPRFATAREAYLAVARDPTLAIVSQAYAMGEDGRPGAHHVGATLTMKTRDGERAFTIVGIQKQTFLAGVFVADEVVRAHFDHLLGAYFLKLDAGADARAFAHDLEARGRGIGLDAKSLAEEAEQFLDATRRLYQLFQMYLGLGLVIGIASLGIATARSVLERRQEIGMLRAIGFPRRLVLASFLLEVLFTAGLGIVCGLAVGLSVAWGVHWTSLRELGYDFVVPWGDLAIVLAVALAATILATLGPSLRASRLPPAEAIRYVE
ncbi:MAG TPA: FtsX-like permease family protein, partial [Candidatus Thermoplasmatota archaeon]|nr:FtsX-like permease family protein [Candidatus Thermoplasmatota archaeon]